MFVILILLIMLTFLFLGMPVAFTLGVAGAFGIYLYTDISSALGILQTVPFRSAASYTLSTVPMFILMAQFISVSGVVDEVFDAAQKWLSRLPGGLAITTIFAAAGMGAMSGSSTAAAAALSTMAIPQMREHGYSKRVSAGVVAVAGTLAIMIPPSIVFIIYGIITETSIGKLLIAGILPGILTALVYCVGIIIWYKIDPKSIPRSRARYNFSEKMQSVRNLWPFILLILIVLGSMYGGIATATEAGALGALGALLIPLFMGRMTFKSFTLALNKSVQSTAMIFAIVIGAMIFGYFLTITQTTQGAIDWIAALDVNRWVIMLLIVLMYLFLGCIMDQIAIILVTIPLTFPLVVGLGFDPIWFGVVVTKTAEIGMATPPLGMNVYVVSATSRIPLQDVFRGAGPLILLDLISLVILLAFPGLSTWLPSTM